MSLSLNITLEEFNMPADGEKRCEECKELITGMMYQDVIFIDNEEIRRESWYCDYCYHKTAEDE